MRYDFLAWRAAQAVAARLAGRVLEGDPGCLCDPELFTGPAGIEAEAERRAQPRKTRLPPSVLLVGLYNVVELSSFARQ